MRKPINFEGTIFGSNDTIKLEITPNEKPVIKNEEVGKTKNLSDSGKAVS